MSAKELGALIKTLKRKDEWVTDTTTYFFGFGRRGLRFLGGGGAR